MSFPPASKFQIWMDDCQRIFSVTSAKITDTAHRLRAGQGAADTTCIIAARIKPDGGASYGLLTAMESQTGGVESRGISELVSVIQKLPESVREEIKKSI